MLRWVAAGVLEAVTGFRRLKGCGDMPRLVTALRDTPPARTLSQSSVQENSRAQELFSVATPTCSEPNHQTGSVNGSSTGLTVVCLSEFRTG